MAPRTSGRARPGTPGSTNTPAMARGLRNTSSSTFNPNLDHAEHTDNIDHVDQSHIADHADHLNYADLTNI